MAVKRKLLIVAMPFSIHVVRWLEMIQQQDWEVHFFSSFPYSKPHPQLANVIFYDHFYNVHPVLNNIAFRNLKGGKFRLHNNGIAKWVRKGFRFLKMHKTYEEYFNNLVKKIQPDAIHSMESQHAGYLVSNYYQQKNDQPQPVWIHSTWGLDIDYFQYFDDHMDKLKRMFSKIDIYIAEGNRDIRYAQKIGYKGVVNIFPCVAGGYRLEKYVPKHIPPSERKTVLIKGYQDSTRRGLFSLTALLNCIDVLGDFNIVVFSPMNEVKDYITYINSKYGLSVKIYEETSYDGWIETLSQTRVLVTNNLSDGNPSTLFECMLMGVFPIQSKTSCADEWLENEITGFLVSPEDIPAIEQALRRALTENDLVDSAATLNYTNAANKINFELIQQRAIEMYTDLLKGNSGTPLRSN